MKVAESGANRPPIGQLLVAGGFIAPTDLGRALAEQRSTGEKLGQVLLGLGLINEDDLHAVLAWQREPTHDPGKAVRILLGEILVSSRVVTRAQLTAALERQQFSRKQIGDILIEAGYAKPSQISAALGIQRGLVAASLVAALGSAPLSGCGTGATLGGVKVYDGKTFRTPYGAFEQVDNVRGAVVPYSGTPVGRTVASQGAHGVAQFDDGSVIIEDVRFIKQGNVIQGDRELPDNTCGQAALTMVLRYWLHDKAPAYQEVVDDSNRFNLATTQETMTNYLKYKGLEALPYKNGKIAHLKSEVDAGRPPIVLLQFSVPHYVVVIGYNEEQGEIIYHDSIDGPNMRLGEDKFKRVWYESDVKDIPFIGGRNYVGLTIAIGA